MPLFLWDTPQSLRLGHLGRKRGRFAVRHCPLVLINVDVVEVSVRVEALASFVTSRRQRGRKTSPCLHPSVPQPARVLG